MKILALGPYSEGDVLRHVGQLSIFVSKAITDNLHWFISRVQTSYGICVFEAADWAADEADVTA
jgi:hypothetical protein